MIVYDFNGNPVEPYWRAHNSKGVPEWRRRYAQVPNEETHYYNINIVSDSTIHENLAKIERRKDGRYDWYIKESSFYKQWSYHKYSGTKPTKLQGVAPTLEEAKRIIEGYWNV